MSEKPSRKKPTTWQKLKAAKKKAIMLGVTFDVWAKIKKAADVQMRPVSQFIVYHALQAAEKVIAIDDQDENWLHEDGTVGPRKG